MLVSKINQFMRIFVLFTILFILQNLASSQAQDQQANEITLIATSKQQNVPKQQHQHSKFASYNVPFLVLMSSNEISVAQFPLIENGRISVVYRLTDSLILDNSNSSQEKERDEFEDDAEEEQEERGGDDHDGTAKSINTDAREYEQQMPPSAQILGKFGWKQQQQIASSASLGRKFISGFDREEVATSKAAGAEQREGEEEEKRPRIRRKRRSNNLTEDHASNRGGRRRRKIRSKRSSINGTMEGNNNGSNVNAVMESSSSSNVTSAQFSTNSGTNRMEQGNRGTMPEGGRDDDKIGSTSFSDFDVHMALGYAFVSDSMGRIHRFRFGGSSDSRGSSNENLMENDYTNTIDAAAKTDASATLLAQINKHTERDFAPLNSTENDVSTTNHGSAHYPDAATSDVVADDDANKVSIGNVAHRQFGRHPTASGSGDSLAESGSGVLSSTNNLMSDSSSGTPISDNLKSGYNNQQASRRNRKMARKLHRFGAGSKPRIIWSRMEHDFSTVPSHSSQQPYLDASQSSSSPLKKSIQSATGAFPQPPNNQKHQNGELLAASGDSSDENQMANETVEQHMVGAKNNVGAKLYGTTIDSRADPTAFGGSESGVQTSADATLNSTGDSGLGQQRRAIINERLRTEIAVDWLNNLLFVLDKYTLLVVDLDGDNELVLIDDFNINNRPIDIKVDPINGFLFWLQVGTFHNTIYKLDFGVLTKERDGNTLKLANRNNKADVVGNQAVANIDCSSELLALISHHYAHPIITNLPQHTKIFTIDHKHSKIYVPLVIAASKENSDNNNKTQREDAEVFVPVSYDSRGITHLNSTSPIQIVPESMIPLSEFDKTNCNTTQFGVNSDVGQILAYNLDGTDVGPLRNDDQRSHLLGFEGMQDMTFDSDKKLLYWLTNDGREIFEEIKSDSDSTFSSGQHLLDGKSYMKMKLFDSSGSNQPATNIRQRLVLVLPTSTNRQIRSDKDRIEDNRFAPSWHQSSISSDVSRFSRNAPFIILGITSLVVLSVYLIYAFVFQRIGSPSSNIGGDSVAGSSIGPESRVDSGPSGFIGGASTISRWMAKPSSRSTGNSTFNRDFGGSDRADGYDIESTNYHTSNAIDEHYREAINNNQALFDLDTGCLANLGEWPTNMHDMSNKLYVPVEVLKDEALSSINRISIDQLEIERSNPLGEGHFGTVLQGTITCKINEKNYLLSVHDKSQQYNSTSFAASSSLLGVQNRRSIPVPSSTSSGHGSSSTSSDFVTATSCAETTNGDYLIPKSQGTSTASDYLIENVNSSRPDSCDSYTNQDDKESIVTIETRFKVAIKKLKDNASMEEKRDFLQEAKLLANFEHPNIVQLIGICLDRGSTLIVMELMLGGDLIRYMQENKPRASDQENLTDDDLLSICLDIVNGCCYLEALNYIHRDLAARNCLVSSRKREERVVKLADFGLARDIYKDSYYKKLNDSAMPLKWMAPECLGEQKFNIMSDVWSFGVVMWEVMSYCQKKPFDEVLPFFMKDHLIGGGRLGKPEKCNEDIYRLMNECWQLQPEDRPTFQECRAVLIEIKNGTTGP